jgi:hypothetical protein
LAALVFVAGGSTDQLRFAMAVAFCEMDTSRFCPFIDFKAAARALDQQDWSGLVYSERRAQRYSASIPAQQTMR